MRRAFLLCVLCLSLGCRRTPPNVDAVKRLSDPNPQVREAAALSLHNMAAGNATAVGDPGAPFWKAKLASVASGASQSQVDAVLGVHGVPGGEGGNDVFGRFYTLDDYWVVTGFFTIDPATGAERFSSFEPLVRHVRVVDVSPPAGFSGKWVTYYVNGAVAVEDDYVGGTVAHASSYFDDGRLQSAMSRVGTASDGLEVTYFGSGKKATEGHYVGGKRSGVWVDYYESGKPMIETPYVGEIDGSVIHWREDGTKSLRLDFHLGKLTGQAAWDASGKPEYPPQGTAADAGR